MEQKTIDMLTQTLGQAITEVCGMMLGETVMVGSPAAAAGLAHRAGEGVRGSIDISGDLAGEASIHLPTETAVNLVSAFVGAETRPDDESFADAIGELANMVVGSANDGQPCRPVRRWQPLAGPVSACDRAVGRLRHRGLARRLNPLAERRLSRHPNFNHHRFHFCKETP